MKNMALAVYACLVVGCTMTLDGKRHVIGAGESAEHRHAAHAQQLAREQDEEIRRLARRLARHVAPANVVMVGETGALSMEDAGLRRRLYRAYVEEMALRAPDHPVTLDEPAFVAQLAGWSSVETFGLAGFVKLDQPMAVRAADLSRTQFARSADALIRGATGDLVVARAGNDGVLVMDRVLCRRAAPDFSDCAARHVRGRFDARTGVELDSDWRPRKDGRVLDVASYQAVR